MAFDANKQKKDRDKQMTPMVIKALPFLEPSSYFVFRLLCFFSVLAIAPTLCKGFLCTFSAALLW